LTPTSKVLRLLERRAFAYRVLVVARGSPLAGLLTPWFDFIIRAGDTDLIEEDVSNWNEERFHRLVMASEELPLRLVVFNTKNRSVRDVTFTPHKRWGRGADLAGVKLTFDVFSDTLRNVIHVLEVQEDSPAATAGLQAHTDYILGTLGGQSFESTAALVSLVRRRVSSWIRLFVYSSVADTVRIVEIVPSDGWPGEGLLGCNIGIGQSHVIPPDSRESLGSFVARPTAIQDEVKPVSETSHPINEPKERGYRARYVKHEVSTDQGYAQIVAEAENGKLIVELDWKLPHGATVVYKVTPPHFEKLPDFRALFEIADSEIRTIIRNDIS